MPVYIIVGPAAALIGIVAVFFVMRHKSVQQKSMYSSRRSQIERKVRAARQRTLAPRGRGDHSPTDAEIASTPVDGAPGQPAYEPPAAPPRSAWDVGPTAAQTFGSSAPVEPPSSPAEPATSAPAEPSWTPGPVEPPVWTPAPAPVSDYTAPAQAPAPAQQEEPLTPAGGGAAWSIVGDARDAPAAETSKDKGKDKKKAKQAVATGDAWSLASGDAPAEGDTSEEIKAPGAAMALIQYAVLVVGLVMVLIGVLVMVANSKVG